MPDKKNHAGGSGRYSVFSRAVRASEPAPPRGLPDAEAIVVVPVGRHVVRIERHDKGASLVLPGPISVALLPAEARMLASSLAGTPGAPSIQVGTPPVRVEHDDHEVHLLIPGALRVAVPADDARQIAQALSPGIAVSQRREIAGAR